MDLSHTLLIEWEDRADTSSNVEVKFRQPASLQEINSLLKECGWTPEGITESQGIARVYYSGSLVDLKVLAYKLSWGGKGKIRCVLIHLPEEKPMGMDARLEQLVRDLEGAD